MMASSVEAVFRPQTLQRGQLIESSVDHVQAVDVSPSGPTAAEEAAAAAAASKQAASPASNVAAFERTVRLIEA
jgi:hypothetical protein